MPVKLANSLLDKIDTVRKIPFFASLADAEARKVAQHLVEKKIARGDYLFWEGDLAEWMYVIKEGKVKLLKSTSLGKEITIELIPPGQVCGTAVIYSPTHLSSAVAESPTMAWGLRRRELESIIHTTPMVARAVMAYLGSRLKAAHDTITGLVTSRAEVRIAAFLMKLVEHHGTPMPQGVRINIPLKRREVADAVGVAVETAIRTLSRFQKEKILSTESKHILILDLPRLKNLTDGKS